VLAQHGVVWYGNGVVRLHWNEPDGWIGELVACLGKMRWMDGCMYMQVVRLKVGRGRESCLLD
jgi:hypothetical protein